MQDTKIKTNTFRILWLSELLQSDAKSIERFLANILIGKHGNIKGLMLMYASNKYDNKVESVFYKNAIKSLRDIKAYYLPGSIQDIRRD